MPSGSLRAHRFLSHHQLTLAITLATEPVTYTAVLRKGFEHGVKRPRCTTSLQSMGEVCGSLTKGRQQGKFLPAGRVVAFSHRSFPISVSLLQLNSISSMLQM